MFGDDFLFLHSSPPLRKKQNKKEERNNMVETRIAFATYKVVRENRYLIRLAYLGVTY